MSPKSLNAVNSVGDNYQLATAVLEDGKWINIAVTERRMGQRKIHDAAYPLKDIQTIIGGCCAQPSADCEAAAELRTRAAVAEAELAELAKQVGESVAERKAAEAERDRLQGIVTAGLTEAAKMREWARDAEFTTAGFVWNQAAGIVEAALSSRVSFTLPTEAPATIAAEHVRTGATFTLSLWHNGTEVKWADNADYWGTPQDVMSDFTGHRLIGADR